MEDQIWGEDRRWKREENAGPTTGMENAGTNNYAEYMYNHSQLLKAARLPTS